jgi:hypothetical protein
MLRTIERTVGRIGDRLVQAVVPQIKARAGSSFLQYCGCYRCGTDYPASNCYFYRSCHWTGQPGGPYLCTSCYAGSGAC